jgi:hypothetical protein
MEEYSQNIIVAAGIEPKGINVKPIQPYGDSIVSFLDELSRILFKDKDLRTYPDIAALAYWCRRSNILRLKREFGMNKFRLGKGLVLHITPTNVPVNFAFSFAFGLLAGNSNIVRIPSGKFPQVSIICSAIQRLFEKSEWAFLNERNSFISYPRNDDITRILSEKCQVRLIWGGDSTVQHIKSIKSGAKCLDIAFVDRYSICIIEASEVLSCSMVTRRELAEGFYRDIFFLDQNACSSPHLILWRGEADVIEKAKEIFWNNVHNYLNPMEATPPLHAIEKLMSACRSAIELNDVKKLTKHDNRIYRIDMSNLPKNIADYKSKYGFFFEYGILDFEILNKIVEDKYQTITTFGVNRNVLVEFIMDKGLLGVDRVVPVGKALEIGVIWDGYDLISSLSRIITNN